MRAGRRADRPARTGSPVYWLSAGLARLLIMLFTRPTFTGLGHLPRQGAALIVSNHLSLVDPAILGAVFPRPLVFMGKEELFHTWSRWLVSRWGVFPVRRNSMDLGALRTALAVLREEQALVVFPEGTRKPGALGEGHPGVAYLAARARCPVVPVALVGTERIRGLDSLVHRPRFEVIVGEPFFVERARGTDAVQAVMAHIAALLPPERRGVYAREPSPSPNPLRGGEGRKKIPSPPSGERPGREADRVRGQ